MDSDKKNNTAEAVDETNAHTDFSKENSQTVSHYEVPNLTSMLYEYTNKEQEYIQRCFRAGNFNQLRELPDSVKPNSILDSNREKQNFAVHFRSKGAFTEADKQKENISKIFGKDSVKFEEVEDNYEAFLDNQRQEKLKSKKKQKDLHGDKGFYPVSSKSKGKYENPFNENDKEYLYPFLNEEDPYEAAKDEVLRHKWIEESKYLYGEFKPSVKENSLLLPGRTVFMEILEEVKKVLLADWNDVNFVIGTNPEEMIEIKFENNSIDTEKGLKIYMNNMISANSVMRKYGLRRISYFWGYKEDDYIYYMVAPPWVKLVVNNVVNFWKIPQTQAQQETESDDPSFSSDEEKDDAKKRIKNRMKLTVEEKKPVLYSRRVVM